MAYLRNNKLGQLKCPSAPKLRLLTAVCQLLVLSACGSGNSAVPVDRPVAQVSVAEARKQDLPRLVSAIGQIEPIDRVEVRTLVDGRVESVLVSDGDDVSADQALLKLDSRRALARVASLRSALDGDRATYRQAELQLRRFESLESSEYVPEDRIARQRSELEVAGARVERNKAELQLAELELEETTISSPVSGKVGKLLVERGEVVTIDQTSPLLIVNRMSPIYVAITLHADAISHMQRLATLDEVHVSIKPFGQEGRESARFAFLDNEVDSMSNTIVLRATIENVDHRFWPGQYVDARVELGADVGVVVVPEVAVKLGPDGDYVFVVDDELRVEHRPVSIARTADGLSIVSSGVRAGERVVVDGHVKLQHGHAVGIASTR